MPDNKKKVVLAENNLDEFKSVDSLKNRVRIVMDINAIPEFVSPRSWADTADSGFVLWDSTKSKEKPLIYITSGDANVEIPQIVDTKGKEIDMDELNNSFEIQEFWRKELWKAKKSPVYFYTNYIATSTKPTQVEIQAYKESIGMTSGLTQDELSKILIAQGKKVTLELLQELKPTRDALDQEYVEETIVLKARVSKELKVKKDNDKLLKRRIVTNLLDRVVDTLAEEFEHYKLPKTNKLDRPMLEATDLDVLIRLFLL